MTRICPDCKTACLASAPYCDACGCDLYKPPPEKPASRRNMFMLSAAIGIAVAVVQYLVTGK